MQYYPIDETLARRAKEMTSHSDYVPGSATAEYRRSVDEAASLAERQKQMLSHSNSFGNDAEKGPAGCRALNRKSIVIGGYHAKQYHKSDHIRLGQRGAGRIPENAPRYADGGPTSGQYRL